jgi:hypothetical protein
VADGKPGPSQRISNIIRIAFAAIGGVVILHWEFKNGIRKNGSKYDGQRTAAPQLIDAIIGLSAVNPVLPDLPIIGSAGLALVADPKSKNVPVTNPYNDDMLKRYVAWSPEAPKDKTATTPGASGDLYFVDSANWQLVYAGHIGDRISPIMTRDAAIALFQAQMTALGNDPSKVGVQLEQAFFNGQVQDLPNLPDPFTVQVFAEAGWSWHSEPGQVSPSLYGRAGGGTIVLNVSMIRSRYIQDKKATEFSFPVTIPSDKDAGVQFAARGNKSSKDDDRDIPTMDELGHIDTVWDAATSAVKPSGTTLTVTVRFPVKDPVTKKLGAPFVTIDGEISSGGGSIG